MVPNEDRVALRFWDFEGARRRGAGLIIDCTEAKVIMPYTFAAHLDFLSRDEALILSNGEEGNGTSIAVYSLSHQRIICRCHFPFAQVPLRARFLTRPESRMGKNCPSSIAKIFVPDPEVNIFAILFKLEQHARSLCCVISTHQFRQKYAALLDMYPGQNSFKWEEWGPAVTRWLPNTVLEPTGTRNIFGCRMLVWGTPKLLDSRSHKTLCLILLDFNPRPIRQGATTKIDGDSHEIVINEETICNDT